MTTFLSGGTPIRVSGTEMETGGRKPAVILLHGAGGSISYWAQRFAPAVARFGVNLYAPHYFDKTGTDRATLATILDGRHFPAWLAAVQDAIEYVASRPSVDPDRIALLGVSLGGFLAMSAATANRRLRAVIELSGGIAPGFEGRFSPSMPPVLVLHGEDDTVVPVAEARKLARLLENVGAEHQVRIMPGENHWFSAAAQGQILMSCAGFLGKYLLGTERTSGRELTLLSTHPS